MKKHNIFLIVLLILALIIGSAQAMSGVRAWRDGATVRWEVLDHDGSPYTISFSDGHKIRANEATGAYDTPNGGSLTIGEFSASYPAMNSGPVDEPTQTPIPEITVTPIPEITVTPIPEITVTPIPEITVTPIPEITVTPIPEITVTPIPEITATPTPKITATPTDKPTVKPTNQPSASHSNNNTNVPKTGDNSTLPLIGLFCVIALAAGYLILTRSIIHKQK